MGPRGHEESAGEGRKRAGTRVKGHPLHAAGTLHGSKRRARQEDDAS